MPQIEGWSIFCKHPQRIRLRRRRVVERAEERKETNVEQLECLLVERVVVGKHLSFRTFLGPGTGMVSKLEVRLVADESDLWKVAKEEKKEGSNDEITNRKEKKPTKLIIAPFFTGNV